MEPESLIEKIANSRMLSLLYFSPFAILANMYEILPYCAEKESRWDRFVMDESVNGTFLQTRKFLNYHPEGRFKDASFLIEKSGIVVAVVPGCDSDGSFVSHLGSTFGGPVVSRDFYSGNKILEIVKVMDDYISENFKEACLKPTAPIFAEVPPDLLDYALEHRAYARHTELSCFSPLSRDVDPLENCTRECRRNFRQSEKFNLVYGEIKDEDLDAFYHFLELSKARYHTRPVHTLSELRLVKERFPEEILFRGVWKDGQYLSGMMIFSFRQARTFHFQYLAPDDTQRATNATTFLFVNSMREAAQRGANKFSWGISTENHGEFLNETLYRFKESFGALPCVNAFYTK